MDVEAQIADLHLRVSALEKTAKGQDRHNARAAEILTELKEDVALFAGTPSPPAKRSRIWTRGWGRSKPGWARLKPGLARLKAGWARSKGAAGQS